MPNSTSPATSEMQEIVENAHQSATGACNPENIQIGQHGATFVDSLTKAGVQVLQPGDEAFLERQQSYWSNTARKLTPSYILRPRSTEEVAISIQALVTADEKFAIRSGGHTQYAGANNIQGGVTIDLSLLDSVEFDESSETVSIGPGGRWSHVYGELAKHGRVVSGGRDGNVGVGGIILGGGYTFFAAKRGFACDDVVSFEVVLADGSCVTADATNNGDLFRALKGGSNNFGVVTKIKMNAIKCDKIWGGLNFFGKHLTQNAIEALIHFTENCHLNEDSHLLFFFTYLGKIPVIFL
jgi:FAD/FMN-containing dehydrogenase